jgi:hypothetical protein
MARTQSANTHSQIEEGQAMTIPKRSPLKAIRAKCLDCSGGQVKEVRQCPITSCPLYPFRMGRKFFDGHGQRCQKPRRSSGAKKHAI